jgi:carboxypeptidase Q
MKRILCRRAGAFSVVAALLLLFLPGTFAQETLSQPSKDPVARIRDEGLNRSKVMETLSYLTEVIGPRLTASPNHRRANDWARDKLACWGLTNAHLEAWGPFGRGWSLKRFSAQVTQPQNIPLIGYPNAWSPGFDRPFSADVVYFDAKTTADLDSFKGKLKGAIVLVSPAREMRARFEPLASRLTETNLLRLANAGEPRSPAPRAASPPPSGRSSSEQGTSAETNSIRAGSAPPDRGAPAARGRSGARFLSFLAREGAALIVNGSSMGDGGTLFVAAAAVPMSESQSTNRTGGFTNLPRPWSTNVPAVPPQITLATEDYNRLVRMIQQGEKLKMEIDLQVEFHEADLMAYNTVAEIPGTDLKDEIVMLGGHLDSWHAGTGATDDGIGVAAAMEAVRLLSRLELKPRRTIRIALWSGEEQGLLGSRAYVAQHFGYYTNASDSLALRTPKDEGDAKPHARNSDNLRPARKLVRLREYEKLCGYFNLDNGGGKIRGLYLQGNEAVRPMFRRWLEPFKDLDAETLTLSNTGGTDHIPFDAIGLPAFQFIQDPLDYNSRTHHSNEDVLDRIQPEDAKQAAVILAAFAYNAAMLDDKLPRKPAD